MPEGMQYDFASKNIVTQAVISPAYAPLSFAGLQTGEFLDLVLSAAVMGSLLSISISSSSARTRVESFLEIARNSRSNAGVMRTRNGPAMTF
jgi:hypothetical protein